MKKIIKTKGIVKETKDLSPTAREIRLSLDEEMDFLAGSFVNIFSEINGQKIRRAYSISSDSENKSEIALTVRKVEGGKMSRIFWDSDILGKSLDLMGPLGLNTSDKINSKKVFLCSFGIGISVIKAVFSDLLKREGVEEIYIITGDLNEKEILYQDFFDRKIKDSIKKIELRRVLSEPEDITYKHRGYIQNNIDDYNFDDSTVYMCGRESHCNFLKNKIEEKKAKNIKFLVEAFH